MTRGASGRLRSLTVGCALLLGACSEGGLEKELAVWTMDDLRAAARANGEASFINGVPARAWVTPAGQPIPQLSAPYGAADVLQAADGDGLNVVPAFAEGRPAAYVTTDVWYDFEEVWVQPMYILVTEFNYNSPFQNVLMGQHPIFGIGPDSLFYSPFWEVYYVKVPPDTPPDLYKSAQQIFDDGLELQPGPNKLCPLGAEGIDLARSEPAEMAVRPLSGENVGMPLTGWGWVDGKRVGYLDFGNNRFTFDERWVVAEEPLFILSRREAAGNTVPIGLPAVGGVGPLYSGKAAFAQGNRPLFGGLWRVYTVILPGTAGVFLPSTATALRASFAERTEGKVLFPEIAPENEARPDAKEYTLRVALNPDCFKQVAKPATPEVPAMDDSTPAVPAMPAMPGFPDTCRWLDSQAKIENGVPMTNIRPTETLVTCPFVEYLGQRVNPF